MYSPGVISVAESKESPKPCALEGMETSVVIARNNMAAGISGLLMEASS